MSVQSEALYFLAHWQTDTPITQASDSLGRTTVLKKFQRQSGAHWIDVRPFVASVAAGHPMAMEDAAWRVLMAAIEEHSHIIVDDFHLLFEFAVGILGYLRSSYYSTVMHAIRLAASSRKCRIVNWERRAISRNHFQKSRGLLQSANLALPTTANCSVKS